MQTTGAALWCLANRARHVCSGAQLVTRAQEPLKPLRQAPREGGIVEDPQLLGGVGAPPRRGDGAPQLVVGNVQEFEALAGPGGQGACEGVVPQVQELEGRRKLLWQRAGELVGPAGGVGLGREGMERGEVGKERGRDGGVEAACR